MGAAAVLALTVAVVNTVFGAPILWGLWQREAGAQTALLVFLPSVCYLWAVAAALWRCVSGSGWGRCGWFAGAAYAGLLVLGLHTRQEGFGSPIVLDVVCAYLSSVPFQIACALRRAAPGPRVPRPRNAPQHSRSATRLAAGVPPTGWKSAWKRRYAAACALVVPARSPRASSTSSDVMSSGPGARSSKSK
ncbi:hypothetical protein EDD29_5978 [Actinocorallia herbida]|uniref:Uncharacterized protein n=1 Tax=Actinocorallia herbida TaxID=58109 RepID=A0A3N1D468_9ACTN|nr:hypothetical protein EDD29_5978 [Actinocorallia herbida]